MATSREAVRFPIHEYFNRIQVAAGVLSPDEERLAFISFLTGAPQVWVGAIPEKGLLEYPRPVTFHGRERPLVLAPEILWLGSDGLAVTMDTEGNEESFIRLVDLKTGHESTVPHEKGRRDFLSFISKDKNWLYYTSNKRNASVQALFRYHLKDKADEVCFEDHTHSALWFTNLKVGSKLLFAIQYANNRNSLNAINLETKEPVVLFHEEDCQIIPVAVLSAREILVTSDYGRDFVSVGVLDVKKKTIRYLFKEEWDQEAFLSPKKNVLAVVENRAGYGAIRLFRWPSMKKIPLRGFSKGVISQVNFSKSGRHMLIGYLSPIEPPDFYRVDLKRLDIQRLTSNYTSRVPQATLVDPRLVSFESQGRRIYSLFFLPKGAKKNRSLPVIVWPHGGPQYQERPQQRPIFQYFLSRGYAIWAPNPTGSTGFGKKMANAINRAWGTADLPDMKNGISWLKDSGWIDPNQMVILGGSYGGYMVLRTLTKIPDVFQVGVDIFGPSNLISFAKSVPEDWRPYMDEFVGNPERDEAMLREQSPYFELSKIRCPLLIVQGARDSRVVKTESERVVEALRAHGRPVEYLVFEDEGHGFFKRENELACFEKVADFIESQLAVRAVLNEARAASRGR